MWWLALAALFANALSSEDEERKRTRTPSQTRAYYRTRDGRADYGFSIERQTDGTYRPYITAHPPYGSRSTGAHETHRLTDSEGRRFVCWDRPLRSEAEAKQVAGLWADATQEYIRTGQRF